VRKKTTNNQITQGEQAMQLKRKSIRGSRRECLVGLGLALASFSAGAELVAGASAAAGQKIGIDFARPYVARPAAWTSPYLLAANSAKDGKASRDALFDDDDDDDPLKPGARPVADSAEKKRAPSAGGIRGFLQFEIARTTASPVHWSKMRTRAEMTSQGTLGDGIKWKIGARIAYDAVYDLYDYYPSAVERDQRFDLALRENYLDISRGDWDFRLGKQHVVWGEMVGLFFADVVSARDTREFLLPDFDVLRIPQWAARAEYSGDNFHSELLWIPVASYDEIGKPGAEFSPYPGLLPGLPVLYRNEERPIRNLANSNYGIRLSTLRDGWDISGFVYSSMDVAPTIYRDAASVPGSLIYQARHDRIRQFGGTMAKDVGWAVLKGEAVHTQGRRFAVLRASDADGVVAQDTLDWALGLDFSLPAETRLNVQLFQRTYFSHDADLISDRQENGYGLLLNHKFSERVEAQAMWIASFNRTDWILRPRVTWNFQRNWRLAVGADVFKGQPIGLFGQFNNRDRVYSEVRYSF